MFGFPVCINIMFTLLYLQKYPIEYSTTLCLKNDIHFFFFFFYFFSFIFISWRLITLQYCSGDIHFLILLLNITNDHLSPHQINLFAVVMSQITIKYNNLEKN